MPKLRPNEKEASSRVVRACISNNMALYSLNEEAMAVKLGVTPRTIQNKRSKPETFTLNELWDLGKALKITPIQAASIVLGRPLTSKEIKEFILL
ncbi:hypothetical protein [Lacrimispora sp. 38-1]|uniref:hypothetical protein n=1 Tax=Lacrimispora sp. 38-1 TaxID=3125778 RepID=UPI003CF91FDB